MPTVTKKKKRVFYKTNDDVEKLRESCLLVCKVLEFVGTNLRPGTTGEWLDKNAEEIIRDYGAVPGFKGYNDFPSTLCISVNDAVVHGIPSNREFRSGDIVSVDCGTFLNGFYGDAAYTFAIGDVSDEVMKLLKVTKESLYLGIEQAVAGKRIGDISHAVQFFCERKHRYGVVRELVGHGVGRNLHEEPEVPNFGKKKQGYMMKENLVIAIEPMVNLGTRNVQMATDNWTIVTKDGKPSAHYEHTVAVKKGQADILSNHAPVEAAIKNNPELRIVG